MTQTSHSLQSLSWCSTHISTGEAYVNKGKLTSSKHCALPFSLENGAHLLMHHGLRQVCPCLTDKLWDVH